MRSAISTTSRSVVIPSNRNVNSSPPNRATVSIGRSSPLSRSPSVASTRSPAGWPSESLISLKLSKSRNSTASGTPERRERSRATPRRSRNRARLGSPVSWSCRAWWASCRLRAFALDRVDQRPPEPERLELGLDQAVLRALPDRAQGQLLVVLGERAARSAPRAPTCARTRAATSPPRRSGVVAGRDLEQHAAAGMVEQRLGGRGVPGSVRDQMHAAPRRVEQLVDQSRRAVIARQQQDPDRPRVHEFIQQRTASASNSSTSLFKPAQHHSGSLPKKLVNQPFFSRPREALVAAGGIGGARR